MKRNLSIRFEEDTLFKLAAAAARYRTTPNRLVETAVNFYLKSLSANGNSLLTIEDEENLLMVLSGKSRDFWADFWQATLAVAENTASRKERMPLAAEEPPKPGKSVKPAGIAKTTTSKPYPKAASRK